MKLLRALSKVVSTQPETDYSIQLAGEVRARKQAWWNEVKAQFRLPANGRYKVVMTGTNTGEIRHKNGQPVVATPQSVWTVIHVETLVSETYADEAAARRAAGPGDVVRAVALA